MKVIQKLEVWKWLFIDHHVWCTYICWNLLPLSILLHGSLLSFTIHMASISENTWIFSSIVYKSSMSNLLTILRLWIFFHEAMPSRYTYDLAVFYIGSALLMFIDIYSIDELSIERTLCAHILSWVYILWDLESKHKGYNCTRIETIQLYVIASAFQCDLLS